MAAVEWFENEEISEAETRPQLRLVTIQNTPQPYRTTRPLAQRRAARALMIKRRRRTLVALVLLLGLVILSLPGVAFGGVSAPVSSDLQNGASLASGMTYEVQSGDSLNSIARMIDPAKPSLARAALVHELDSTVVVTGERVLIP
jgi:hypothetical protein